MTDENTILKNNYKRRWSAVIATSVACWLLSLFAIYGVGDYGLAVFVFLPFFLGALSTMIYAFRREVSWKGCWRTTYITLGIFTIGLIAFAIEGLICILMAAPIGWIFTWIGSAVTYALISRSPQNAPLAVLVAFICIPVAGFVEKDSEPEFISVKTSVLINASPENVWKQVVVFPELNPPTEILFKAGIAYPINAEISGTGVGAVRYCNFSTGSFVEPITVWNEPHLLAFDVRQQPPAMKELSFWDVDAPHLQDYFASRKGQFKLIRQANGQTLLEGTTWYSLNIKPAIYWQPWSDYIIHKIHNRVLLHIKANAEKKHFPNNYHIKS